MDTDKGWLLPQECFPDGTPEEWSDSTYRLALKSSVDYQLKELLRMTKSEKLHIAVLRAMLSLNTYFDVNERVIQRHEGQRGWDRFRLLHRQLSGLASEFYALAAACPESACGAFKAQQVNRILAQMKEKREYVAEAYLANNTKAGNMISLQEWRDKAPPKASWDKEKT